MSFMSHERFVVTPNPVQSQPLAAGRRPAPWMVVMVAVVLAGVVGMGGGGVRGVAAEPVAEPVLEGCLVSLIEEVKVPAREPGVIMQLAIREGAIV